MVLVDSSIDALIIGKYITKKAGVEDIIWLHKTDKTEI
jgi:hypothetical protein